MMSRPMHIATLLGLFGLLPFFGCAAAALLPWAYRDLSLLGLLAYGACILSFLGAVHWGFVLAVPADSAPAAPRLRLALGTVPSLIGWVALVLGFAGFALAGIGLVLIGLIATVLTEARWMSRGMVPTAYFHLRVVLTTLVCLTLASVLTAQIMGISV